MSMQSIKRPLCLPLLLQLNNVICSDLATSYFLTIQNRADFASLYKIEQILHPFKSGSLLFNMQFIFHQL